MRRRKKYPWQRWPTGGSGYYRQNKPTASRSSFSGIHRRSGQDRLPPTYSNSGVLLKAKLPLQRNLTEKVKEECVELVRKKWGDKYAEAASKALDLLIPEAVRGASLTLEADANVSRTRVKGSVTAEFTLNALAAAGVPLAELSPSPVLHVKASFNYSGNLETGALTLSRVVAEADLNVA